MPERLAEEAVAPLEIDAMDRGLAGGLPRGQVSEVVGSASSGRTSLVWAALGAATRRGEYVALVDTFDRFDPPTGAACGIDLTRLLWARGQAISKTAGAIDPSWLPGVRPVGGAGTMVERTIDRALKALNLVVQSRVCTVVAIDLIDVPAVALRRLPASTWFRIERAIEGSEIAVVLLASAPVARSRGGRSISLGSGPDSRQGSTSRQESISRQDSTSRQGSTSRQDSTSRQESSLPAVLWNGEHDRTRRFAGVKTSVEIGAAHWSQAERVVIETTAINAV